MSEIARPAIRWFGSKWSIAPWIIEHFPPHHCYVEPFAGSLSVLLRKPPSAQESASDSLGDVVHFFRVLREQPAAFIRAIKRTPYAAAEVELAKGPAAEGDIERARRFFVLCWQTIAGAGSIVSHTGFRRTKTAKRSQSAAGDWQGLHRGLPAVAKRLRGVILEIAPAAKIMASYDAPGTLFYVDPPYLVSARRSARTRYANELASAEAHTGLLDQLRGLAGMVALSGYRSALYDAQLAGWERFETEGRAHGLGERTECLWLNPRAAAGLRESRAQLHIET